MATLDGWGECGPAAATAYDNSQRGRSPVESAAAVADISSGCARWGVPGSTHAVEPASELRHPFPHRTPPAHHHFPFSSSLGCPYDCCYRVGLVLLSYQDEMTNDVCYVALPRTFPLCASSAEFALARQHELVYKQSSPDIELDVGILSRRCGWSLMNWWNPPSRAVALADHDNHTLAR